MQFFATPNNSMSNFIQKIGSAFWNNLGPGRLVNDIKNVNAVVKGDIEPKTEHALPPTKENLEKIQDKTFENIEQPITTPQEEQMQVSNNSTIQQAFENAKKLQEEQWAREDEIRAHVEEREDNAWQRSIRDMIKAGINPNLVNASPASSGGGITQSTGIDYTIYEKEFDQNLDMIMQEIEQNFEGSQAEKDRIKDLIKSLITGGALLGGAAIRGGK